jgi:HD-GYP domain-containing protein (c-di-GMP phosphodiesterase class II)
MTKHIAGGDSSRQIILLGLTSPTGAGKMPGGSKRRNDIICTALGWPASTEDANSGEKALERRDRSKPQAPRWSAKMRFNRRMWPAIFDAPQDQAHRHSLLPIKAYPDDLDADESAMTSLALAIEARDSTTAGHCERLALYASDLGRTLGLDEDDISALAQGGFLHDVGKIGVPDAVLLKPGPLTADEYDLIKQHTVIGDRLCCGLRSLRRVRPIVRHHHERLDGSGYPDGLRGDATPLFAQIMGIVDVFDALTTQRPYKVALPVAWAADELRREVARGWRRGDLVDTFLDQVEHGRDR